MFVMWKYKKTRRYNKAPYRAPLPYRERKWKLVWTITMPPTVSLIILKALEIILVLVSE